MRRTHGAARLLAGLVCGVVLAVAGCGVPSSGTPVVVRDATVNGAPSSSDGAAKEGPGDVTDAEELVRRYLTAVAGGNETSQDQPDAFKKAAEWAQGFLTTEAAASWQPGQAITVVRARIGIAVATANGTRVEVALQPVGTLDSSGTVEPVADPASRTYQITVVPAARGTGLRIADPPPGMLLSTEGLGRFYEVHPIYFWDTEGRNLVPDLRYISILGSADNRLVQLTSWLRDGPSDFLRQVAAPLPAAIEIKDRPGLEGTAADRHVRVNLSAKAASVPPPQLTNYIAQLRWSLRPLDDPVELQIENQRQDLQPPDVLSDNAAVAPSGQRDPPRFAVVGGQVRQIEGDATNLPVLADENNSGVVRAAILRGTPARVGLVRGDGAGRVRLWLGWYDEASETARYSRTGLGAAVMSRPVGLLTPDGPTFLVAADGRLYSVQMDGVAVDRTPAGVGAVTAVSVAPEGRRVAFVANGRPYVAVLRADGALAVGPPVELRAGLSDVVGVAWSRENWLVVAGRVAGQSALVELTTDSVLVEPLQLRNLPGLTVTGVAADPAVKFEDTPRGERALILMEANGRAYRVYSLSVVELAVDGTPSAPSPTPSASTSANPAPPTAPFFLD
ncbi:MAG: hypothetical protein QOE03_1410 [Micromonosporaceae bacterium]|nr:hypothetical protein [Micromonosporaceae bacterium]